MSRPPRLKIVKTWNQLSAEIRNLKTFHKTAEGVCDDLQIASDLRDEELLRKVLAKYVGLKPNETFRVVPGLYDDVAPVLN